jgi:hypothetical protein
VRTDAATAHLDIRGSFAGNYTYELAATAGRTLADDDSTDEKSFAGRIQLLYRPDTNIPGLLDLSFGLVGSYESRHNDAYDQKMDEFRLTFIITSNTKLTL